MNNINNEKMSLSSFFTKIYFLVGVGIGVSAIVSFLTITSGATLIQSLSQSWWPLLVVWLIQMFVVIAISPLAYKNSPLVFPLFILFSALTGFTLTFSLVYFTLTSIFIAFAISSIMFIALALFGALTKKDLSGLGKAAFTALIGLIVASIVNIFLQLSVMSFILSIISVIIFSILIAYDNQRIKEVYNATGGDINNGWAISMALSLYLDFINIFLTVLNLVGGNSD